MYSDIVMQHFKHPNFVGTLPNPDGVGVSGTVGKGNYVVVHISVEDGRIAECGYLTYGCAPAIAAGSILMTMINGIMTTEAATITAEELEGVMGGLPMGRYHCVVQAVEALQAALQQLLVTQ